MRSVNFALPILPDAPPDRTAQLVRHLTARLNDFGPGGPEVIRSDQAGGTVSVRFPGHDTQAVLNQLASQHGISVGVADGCALFSLSPSLPFEDLDYTWGALFSVL